MYLLFRRRDGGTDRLKYQLSQLNSYNLIHTLTQSYIVLHTLKHFQASFKLFGADALTDWLTIAIPRGTLAPKNYQFRKMISEIYTMKGFMK